MATEPPALDPSQPQASSDPAAASPFQTDPPVARPFDGPVVGIGASAGGLDALERFFGALPMDTGAAFVVIQHLSPDHKSMMDNLLSRYTGMPVQVAENNVPLQANTVFLIPPGKQLAMVAERLRVSPKAEQGLNLPIDIFFHSLAEQCGDRTAAVVLSGTGSDGSRGVAAVNAAGGFVFVQSPTDAKFDGMPRSAIGTGVADVVAPADDLARRLAAQLLVQREPLMSGDSEEAAQEHAEPLEAILQRLVTSTGIDFREYKPTTVLRRIERRMLVLHARNLTAYLQRLIESPEELSLLRRELLIPVTRFFRDTEAFEQLATDVLPGLVTANSAEPIRVWVACCATGEEAYSLAILFAEAFQRLGRSRPVKIFATDVEQQYLDQAVTGIYPDTIAAEVSATRLAMFFVPRPGGYTVRADIRQMVIFARHNLVGDPPFTRMDLVSCRNALIYFQPVAQERALRRLQYALLTGGHLLLGPSESLGVMHRDFASLPGRQKIYRLLRHDRMAMALGGVSNHMPTTRRLAARRGTAHGGNTSDTPTWVTLGQRQLLQTFAPPTLLIGPSRELLHVYGSVKGLLQFNEGQVTLDVLKLMPRELSWAAGLLLQAVSAESRTKSSAVLRLAPAEDAAANEEPRRIRLTARPVLTSNNAAGAETPPATLVPTGLVLLSFESADEPSADTEMTPLDAEQQRRVESLERELEVTHDSLQATIEELETANEELQAANEELMASNEELQSTNEELQSVNEELYTVNSEFQAKVDVLNSVNADMENIAKATAIPTLFVDDALRLTRFTPELSQLFKVRESDRGRAIEDFAHQLDYPNLFVDLRNTLASEKASEREVRGRDGQWWLARIQPYSSRVSGASKAVMSFVNVTSLKDSQHLQSVLDSLPEHLAVLDAQGNITMVNAAWRQFAKANTADEAANTGPGTNYLAVCAQSAFTDEDARRAHSGLAAVLGGKLPLFTLRYPCHTPQRRQWFVMHVAPVNSPAGGAVVSHIDVTDWATSQQPEAS